MRAISVHPHHESISTKRYTMPTTTIPTLLDLYKVDQAHARQVADLSLALFDTVAERYRLAPAQRRLLELGALLHNLGLTTDPPDHHIVGRDLVLRHQIADLSQREQQMVACLVAFHRKRVRPSLEPAFLALGEQAQHEALQLAAILRVADGLDYHHTQTTHLLAVEPSGKTLTLMLDGPSAAADGARGVAKADLWRKIFGETITAVSAQATDAASLTAPPVVPLPTTDAPATPHGKHAALGQTEKLQTEPSATTHLDDAAEERNEDTEQTDATDAAHLDDTAEESSEDSEHAAEEIVLLAPWYAASAVPLAELGRVLLRRHLRRLRMAERDVRADKDILAIHALRVATRRLRSTLRLLAPVYSGGDMRTLTRGVGRIGRAAGAVRDRDVLLADLEARAPAMPSPLGEAVTALRTALSNERQAAHAALLTFLDSRRYQKFIRRFAKDMNSLDQWDNDLRVRDLGGSTIWQHYEALRAYDREGLPVEDIETLHLMRIEGKRMRYVLELFTDTLSSHTHAVVAPLVTLQDQLGILNDIAVASGLLAAHARAAATGPAVKAYLALRDEQAAQVLEALPACWQQVANEQYRRGLAELLVQL
ncbi:MAG: CHAD domain-containing protein [Candidatus Viridilinea halotolerans]|uniref:CHAD domain-containing protein n=1 Tax=Candidatus Viridilinea halotolerans TaxID=2491704 RepID=A0A426TQ71_9CHLR|nr:MAG: CHAD domain-containing protein [Candidatus Viridilinea halotolerans]